MTSKKYRWWLTWLVVGITLSFFWMTNPAIAREAKHYDQLNFGPFPQITLPEYERYQLDNGMVVYLVEDHDLPLISGQALFRMGSRWETSEQVGLAELMGITWRIGGTEKYTPETINKILEEKAANIESNIDISRASLSFNALSQDTDFIISLFAQIMRQPAFAPEQIEVAKTQLRGSIARRNDDPGDIASREFNKLIYGSQNPYARTLEYDTLEPLNREDIQEFYSNYVRPDGLILGIVGDFDSQTMKELIASSFGDWQVEKPATELSAPEMPINSQTGLFLIEQPQLTQSNILLGHLGIQLDNPDYPALSVLNNILNGFGGRLFQEVRSRQGLAYSVYGMWTANYDYPGLFIAGGQTRSDATVPFIDSIFAEIQRLQTTPVTEAELEYGKNSLLNSFVFRFAAPSQTLLRLMYYEYYGYDSDFIFQYQAQVKATQVEDITRVAQKYLQPEALAVLVVGNPQTIQPPLSQLGGQIQVLDISIPQPAES